MKTFWSWQSDHPGPISRHFVREALEQAIEALNADPEIEEANRPEVTLDHDRKGVPGSPDLARTIFEKIETSQVFVADVTPVGATPGDAPKKLMNANVAIELGFALATVTDRGLIMILNEHYGKRQDLPFDLQHKAGPISYRLAPGASKEEIARQRAELVGRLKVALRDMLKSVVLRAAAATPFVATPSIAADPARYVAAGEILVAEEGPGGDRYRYVMPSGAMLYLRLIPTQTLRLLRRSEAHDLVRELEPFYYQTSSRGTSANAQGALSYSSSHKDGRVICGSQLFLNREIWAFDNVMLSGSGPKGPGFPTLSVEQTYAIRLREYVKFATEKLSLTPPFALEAGATGVKNFMVFLPSNFWDDHWGPVHEDQIVWKDTLESEDASEVDRALLAIFEAFFDGVGRRRPPQLYKFPGDHAGATPTR